MSEKKQVVFIAEATNTGYSAWAEDYSILTVGKDREDLAAMAQEALGEQCDYLKEDVNQYEVVIKYEEDQK